jgi:predicted dehydrogenase
MKKRTYLLVGTGPRGIYMFGKPLLNSFYSEASLIGLLDNNPLRIEAAKKILGKNLPGYTDFDKAIKELNPDCVIICSKDSTHAQYIIRSLEYGKDAISEKPLCINKEQCMQIINAEKKFKGKVVVSHNYRYEAAMPEIKKLISNGTIGEILSIDFHEKLDRIHGASYFRRWHRKQENSGGLLIHKACHCFDLINWLVGSEPKEVFASGGLIFYGKNNKFRSKRCYGCSYAEKCEFYFDLLADKEAKHLYFDAESEDGYIRDSCVFDKEINIVDTANVLYKYRNGVFVNFSLMAYCSYEGINIIIEGTKGRLEYNVGNDTKWLIGKQGIVHGLEKQTNKRLLHYLPNGKINEIKIKVEEGGHGGGDPKILNDLFCTDWFRTGAKGTIASVKQAVDAVLIGDAANESIETGKVVLV